MNIYVAFTPPKTLSKFLARFFGGTHGWNGSYSVHTYKDAECTKIQRFAGRNRSIQDLWECVKTYYPDTTLTTVVSELIKFKVSGRHFTPYRCSTIKRPVIQFSKYKLMVLPRATTAEYSWGRLIRQLGISSLEEFYNY